MDYDKDYVEGDFDGGPMCSIGGVRLKREPNIKVKARTIDSILKEKGIKKVDLFVIDVEGQELNVLKGIDFDFCSPMYLLIEVYSWDKDKIDEFLFKNGYELICNLSNYSHDKDPYWDGTHNDYLYKMKNEK